MKKSIQQAIKDCSRAIKVGIVEVMVRRALISDGWNPMRADLIVRWAKMYVVNTKGHPDPYPDPTVITVQPDSVS